MESTTLADLLGIWAFIFVEDFLRYFLVAGALAYLLYRFGAWADSRRIQPRRASAADRRREQRYSALTIFIFSLTGLSIFGLSELGLVHLNTEFTALSLFVEVVLIIVAHDAYFYWMHRGLHASRRLMRVHALHHRSRTPSPWAAYSFSAGEAVLEAVFLPIYALLMPMHGITAFIFTSHMIIRNVLGHAGVEVYPRWWPRHPLTRWMTTTTHHDLHHAEFKHNFGLYFTWWDRWMGTEHPHYLERFEQAHRAGNPLTPKAGTGFTALTVMVVGLCFMTHGTVALAETGGISGCWSNSAHSMHVEFRKCGSASCGVLKNIDRERMDNKPLSDSRNTRRRLRKRALLGINLAHLTERQPNNRWRGTLYRPDKGIVQTATFKVLDNGSLKIRACSGHRCKSLYWHPVDTARCE